MKQVNKDHYTFSNYCYFEHWASYWYQIREILKTKPKSVLEIGAGDFVVKDYVSKALGIKYVTMDVAEDLNPDVLGSIDSIPLEKESFDTVLAFEVLEHLPFEKFETCLSELRRVSKKNVIISVPNFGPMISLNLKFPFIKRIIFAVKLIWPKKHVFNGQHYWEIGKKDYPLKRIVTSLEKFFVIENTFIPYENQYHRFFVMEKK